MRPYTINPLSRAPFRVACPPVALGPEANFVAADQRAVRDQRSRSSCYVVGPDWPNHDGARVDSTDDRQEPDHEERWITV